MARTVLAFGSFDILHPGHVLYLSRASRLGGRLVVIVARDSSIRRFKHREPAFHERDRLAMIRALRFVDEAHLGNRLGKDSDMYRILARFNPDVIALGYDQHADLGVLNEWIRRNRPTARIVRIRGSLGKGRGRYKSSKLAEKARGR